MENIISMNQENENKTSKKVPKIATFVIGCVFSFITLLLALLFYKFTLDMPTEGVESLAIIALLPMLLVIGFAEIITFIVSTVLQSIVIKKTSKKGLEIASIILLVLTILSVLSDIITFVIAL